MPLKCGQVKASASRLLSCNITENFFSNKIFFNTASSMTARLGSVYTGSVGTVPYGTDWNCLELIPM